MQPISDVSLIPYVQMVSFQYGRRRSQSSSMLYIQHTKTWPVMCPCCLVYCLRSFHLFALLFQLRPSCNLSRGLRGRHSPLHRHPPTARHAFMFLARRLRFFRSSSTLVESSMLTLLGPIFDVICALKSVRGRVLNLCNKRRSLHLKRNRVIRVIIYAFTTLVDIRCYRVALIIFSRRYGC